METEVFTIVSNFTFLSDQIKHTNDAHVNCTVCADIKYNKLVYCTQKKNNKMDMMLRHQLVPRRFLVSRGTYDIPASENAVLAIIGKSFVCACICD